MKNLHRALFHSRRFNLSHTRMTDRWFYFLESVPNAALECSFKVSQSNALHPWRYNIWFHGDHQNTIPLCVKFIQSYEQTQLRFDFSKFTAVYGWVRDRLSIRRVVFGVDFREQTIDSRLKIWFVVSGYGDGFLDDLFTLYGLKKSMKCLVYNQNLLIGFDFCFSGLSSIKLYPVLFHSDFYNPDIHSYLYDMFSPNTRELMRMCDRFHIGMKEGSDDIVLHFHPINWEHFVNILMQNIKNHVFESALEKIRCQKLYEVFISLSSSEIYRKKIDNINFYYM